MASEQLQRAVGVWRPKRVPGELNPMATSARLARYVSAFLSTIKGCRERMGHLILHPSSLFTTDKNIVEIERRILAALIQEGK